MPWTELRALLLVVVIALAVALPQPTLGRKVVAFALTLLAALAALSILFGGWALASKLRRARFHGPGQARLRRRLADPRAERRLDAAVELRLWGPEAAESVPELSAAVADPDPRVREAVMGALGAIGPAAADAVPALVAALASGAQPWCAARALGAIGPASADAVPALARALEHPLDATRASAAEALGGIGDETAVPALIRALEDPYYLTRCLAANALGAIGHASSVAPLIARLGDDRVYVHALRALGRLGTPAGIAALEALLEHPDPGRRDEARRALARATGMPAPES